MVVIIVVLCAVVVWSNRLAAEHQEKVERARNPAPTIRYALDNYQAKKGVTHDSWWLNEDPNLNMETYSFVTNQTEVVKEALATYGKLNSETMAITKRFQEVVVMVGVNGEPRTLHPKGAAEKKYTNHVAVCFISKEEARRIKLITPLWMTDANLVLIPAMNYPRELFIAILYHELGHARRHNKTDGLPGAAANDKAALQEEVEMHELGRAVLNNFSTGAYHRVIDDIIKRYPAKTPQEAIAMVTQEDCRLVDEMFECEKTFYPSSLLLTQFFMDIGFRYCEQKGLGMDGKTDVYRWFQRNIFFEELPK